MSPKKKPDVTKVGALRDLEAGTPTEEIYRGIILKLDYRKAIRTCARTFWRIAVPGKLIDLKEAADGGIVKIIFSTWTRNKTHWNEYIQVLRPSFIKGFMRVKISKRCNISSEFYTIDEMEGLFRPTKSEYFALKILMDEEKKGKMFKIIERYDNGFPKKSSKMGTHL